MIQHLDIFIIISALVAYLGLYVGNYIAASTKEEHKNGMKYWKILDKLILLAILIIPMAFLKLTALFYIVYLVALVVLMFTRLLTLHYIVLGIFASIIFLQRSDTFFIVMALIFAYGLVAATIKFKPMYIKERIINHLPQALFLIPFFLL